MGERIRVTTTCVLDDDDLEWLVSRSGGPGGQHANTSDTKVEVRLDVAAARSLTESQRERLLARAGPVVRAVAADTRSQARNRELARERLVAKLADALRVQPRRLATRPSRGAKETRLAAKQSDAAIKRHRRRPRADED
jgi:ribosome-associated protein